MTTLLEPESKDSSRCDLVAWLSLCMLAAAWGPVLGPEARQLLGRLGTFGLVAAVGLQTARRARGVLAGREEQRNVRRRADLAIARFIDYSAREPAITDLPTGLFNRHFLDQALECEVPRARKYGWPLSLLLVQLERLDDTQRCCGQEAADKLIKAVAECLRQSVRGSDMLVRYDRHQFAVLLPQTDHEGAQVVARRIKRTLEQLALAELCSEAADTVPELAVSLGSASLPADCATGESLLQLATESLQPLDLAAGRPVEASGDLNTSATEEPKHGADQNPPEPVGTAVGGQT